MRKTLSILMVFAFLLAACAGSQYKAPETPKELLAYTWASLNGVYDTMNEMYDTGQLSKLDAAKGLTIGSEAETFLEVAEKALSEDNQLGFDEAIDFATAKIKDLHRYLAEKEVDK